MMQNLIKNAQWFSQSNGKILYFTNHGDITYDKFCMDNHRFCSLSMKEGTADNRYDVKADITNADMIRFGYHMRAIVLDEACLWATFYDEHNKELTTCKKEITSFVDYDFHDVCASFQVPPHAITVSLSLHFKGTVTACTFGMPFLEVYGNADEDICF